MCVLKAIQKPMKFISTGHYRAFYFAKLFFKWAILSLFLINFLSYQKINNPKMYTSAGFELELSESKAGTLTTWPPPRHNGAIHFMWWLKNCRIVILVTVDRAGTSKTQVWIQSLAKIYNIWLIWVTEWKRRMGQFLMNFVTDFFVLLVRPSVTRCWN